MQFKLKHLVAAMGLAAAAAAHAQSVSTLIAPTATGAGELMFVVWDANQSYTLDLGITFSQFLASSNASATWATLPGTNANWSSFLATADQAGWQYAVLTGNLNNSGVNNAAILSTVNADFVGTVVGTYNNSDVQTALAQVSTYATNVGLTGTHFGAGAVPNGDSLNLKGTAGYFQQSAMDTFNGTLYNNSTAVGTNSAFELVQRTQTTSGDPTETLMAGTVSFRQVGGNYVLSYSVAAVPEPSGYALALAGFGALGFVGVRRRNRG